jgi:outer membrane biosynthesis protein TonB
MKPKESEEPKIKPKKPKESEEPKIKPKKPKESEEPKMKPKESEEPKIKPKKPKESEEPKMKPTVPEVILIDSDSDDSKPTPVDTVPVTREEIIEVRNVPKMDIDTEITPIPGSKGLARLRIRIRINPDDLTINPGGPIIGRKTRIGVKVGPRTEDDKSRVKVKVSTSPVHRSTNFME